MLVVCAITEVVIPRKWKYIADQLRELNAPKKVINAAIEIDNILVDLGLGFNTQDWCEYYYSQTLSLYGLVHNANSCSACTRCDTCVMGDSTSCTPRRKYADDYYRIVSDWTATIK